MTQLVRVNASAPHKDSGEPPFSWPVSQLSCSCQRITRASALCMWKEASARSLPLPGVMVFGAGAMCRSSAATRRSITISKRPAPGTQEASQTKPCADTFLDSQESTPGVRKRKASMVQDPISQPISIKRASGAGLVRLETDMGISTAPL